MTAQRCEICDRAAIAAGLDGAITCVHQLLPPMLKTLPILPRYIIETREQSGRILEVKVYDGEKVIVRWAANWAQYECPHWPPCTGQCSGEPADDYVEPPLTRRMRLIAGAEIASEKTSGREAPTAALLLIEGAERIEALEKQLEVARR